MDLVRVSKIGNLLEEFGINIYTDLKHKKDMECLHKLNSYLLKFFSKYLTEFEKVEEKYVICIYNYTNECLHAYKYIDKSYLDVMFHVLAMHKIKCSYKKNWDVDHMQYICTQIYSINLDSSVSKDIQHYIFNNCRKYLILFYYVCSELDAFKKIKCPQEAFHTYLFDILIDIKELESSKINSSKLTSHKSMNELKSHPNIPTLTHLDLDDYLDYDQFNHDYLDYGQIENIEV